MDPVLFFPIKSFSEKSMIWAGNKFQPGFSHINASANSKTISQVFPLSFVYGIVFRWKFGYPEMALFVKDISFRPGSTERRSRSHQHGKPFFYFNCVFIGFNQFCPILEFPDTCPRWSGRNR